MRACVNIDFHVMCRSSLKKRRLNQATLSEIKHANERVCVRRSFFIFQGAAARLCHGDGSSSDNKCRVDLFDFTREVP